LITRNRRDNAISAARRLLKLTGSPRILILDNASSDGTAEVLRQFDPRLEVVALPEDYGAVARNIGVEKMPTPYIAFCDDDTWWEPGSLKHAVAVLDQFPRVAALTARIIVEPYGTEDPIVDALRNSPVQTDQDLPGPALGSFLAGATVVRRDAFLAAGGFSEKLWFGGEEELLATDLMCAGYELRYIDDMVVHHSPSQRRDSTYSRRLGIRNNLWFTWLRRPFFPALRRTVFLIDTMPHDRTSALAIMDAARGMAWVARHRKVRPRALEHRLSVLDKAPVSAHQNGR